MPGNLAPLHILIVDDSLHIRRLVLTMLRAMGCVHIHEAKNIAQARDILARKPIDLALIDWMLDDPAGTGMDLVTFIRKSGTNDMVYLPIIMMTGHTERENIELARDMGVTEFLAKPFTARNLHTRLAILIDQPRPFVKTRSFFGPDRRRRHTGPGVTGERRLHLAKRTTT